jgi:predicted transposase/invertase (TIGR01784 family)
MTLLSARSDYIFKLIFADERNLNCLQNFLQAVLNLQHDEFTGLKITDPFLQRESLDDKLGILDVKVETTSGQRIDIEIQLWDMPDMRSRITYYLSNMITEQLSSGSPYRDLCRAVSIVIVDYPLLKETQNHHAVFQMIEQKEHFPFNNLMEINVLDLTKIPQNQSGDLINWMKFLKAEREEEFEVLAKTNTAIGQAYTVLRELSDDEVTRLRNESYLKAKRDEWSRVAGAREEGLEEGLQKGIKKGRAEGLQKGIQKGLQKGLQKGIQKGRAEGREAGRAELIRLMAQNGINPDAISSLTGIPLSQVEDILNNANS